MGNTISNESLSLFVDLDFKRETIIYGKIRPDNPTWSHNHWFYVEINGIFHICSAVSEALAEIKFSYYNIEVPISRIKRLDFEVN